MPQRHDPTGLRDRIFELNTRKFGSVGEKLIERVLEGLGHVVGRPSDSSHDRIVDLARNEFKCSRVVASSRLSLEADDLLEAIMSHGRPSPVAHSDRTSVRWDCNIQQVKPRMFDTLWYGLFFSDRVALFRMPSASVESDPGIRYSGRQHRGNEGEGQFHVTDRNVSHHESRYLARTLTYGEVYDLLSSKKKAKP
jgi:hypothetical protein